MPRAAETARVEPEGLVYRRGFLTPEAERQIVELLEAVELHEVTMRGQTAKRTVRHYGVDYDYQSRDIKPSEPLPRGLEGLRTGAAELAGLDRPEDFAQALVSRYPPGAGIGWHRDVPIFGPTIVGVSLLSPCRMRFQRRLGDVRYIHDMTLEPRSAYVLGGRARSAWQHSIPKAEGLRYSITFRTLK
jgi:alkylated DNA repair protein (DNA oxidative demethylase)